uniref:NR LBD domain-containing protein n=2 Tax=Steinernema glaseri TaxID=37863 RepID=A0A1I7YJI8_9BILA
MEQGKNTQTDFATLESLSEVIENNLGMLACIARASRSYSIGLRNADLELAWTIMHCSRTAIKTKTELECLSDHFGIVRHNPTLLNVGRAVLDLGGYCIESPIERNW